MYTNAWSLYADLTSQNRSNQDGTIIFLLREADASYMYTYVLQRFFVVVVVVVVVVVLLFLLFFSLPVQCCFTSTETIRTIRDGEPRTSSSTFTQRLSCE